MKKFLLILASATLLLAGCAKEIGDPAAEGGMVGCTFTADMRVDATKAVADGDGKGVNANRCVMEVYYDGELYTRQVAAVSSYKASFTTQLVSNRTYTVAFWADCVEDATTSSGLATDQYYTTDGENGLQEISLKGTYAGNNDARDAFFHTGSYTVAQAGSTFTATLYRPFAQINVITNDWDKVSKISALKPSGVDVTIANPLVKFNAVTGEASEDASVSSLNYSADVCTSPAPVTPVSETEKTLSMDYLFASADQAVIDIDWKATKASNADVEHSFTNIPYKRNHRTNIKGALLTTTGQWNVTVDPIWDEPEQNYVVAIKTVFDIDGANTFVAETTADQYDVNFAAKPNDSGVPTGEEDSPSHAILTTPLKTDNIMNVSVETATNTLYVGDYIYEYKVSGENLSDYLKTTDVSHATVNINIPTGGSIQTLIINAPSKSVYLNGALISSVGTLTNVDATTANSTLIVEQGQKIGTLTVHQGGVEIHEISSDYVGALVVNQTDAANNPVKFRACEHLSQSVFDAIYKVANGAVEHDYIDRPTWAEKANTSETGTWDIVPAVCKIGEIGYATLADAVAAVPTDGTETTITMLADHGVSDVVWIKDGKNIKLDLNNHTVYHEGNKLIEVVNATLNVTGTGALEERVADGYAPIRARGSQDASASNYTTVTIGSNVTLRGDYAGIFVSASESEPKNYGLTVNMYGTIDLYASGEYYKDDEGYGMYVNGNCDDYGAMFNILGAKIRSTGTGIYGAGMAAWNLLSSTSINAKDAAVELRAGYLNISSGTYTATATSTTVTGDGNGSTTSGAAIAIAQHGTKHDINVTINGGTFNGYSAFYESNPQNNSEEDLGKVSLSISGGQFAATDGGTKAVYSEDKTGFVSGGIYSNAPEEKYVATGREVVENTTPATMDKYPYKVAFKLPGSGTAADPYTVGSAEDLMLMANCSGSSYFKLTSDIVSAPSSFSLVDRYGNKYLLNSFTGTFDGNGHKLTMPASETNYCLCYNLQGTVQNVEVEFHNDESSLAMYLSGGLTLFKNVKVSGELLKFSGNCGTFGIYGFGAATFENCSCSATITGTGGSGDYNAAFVGYVYTDALFSFKNCEFSGKMVCGRSAMFIGNPNQSDIKLSVEDCTNSGTIISTYVDSRYKMNYYYSVTSNNYSSFTLNGTSHTGVANNQTWVPTCQEDNLVKTTGSAINGPVDCGMALKMNAQKQFVLTPATGGRISGTCVDHYIVSAGLYVGYSSGSSRFYATETITPDGSASYTTVMKDWLFVDRNYVGTGEIVKKGDNNTYTDATGSYYVINEGYYTTINHAPAPAEMYSVSAFDANGVLLATANLTK